MPWPRRVRHLRPRGDGRRSRRPRSSCSSTSSTSSRSPSCHTRCSATSPSPAWRGRVPAARRVVGVDLHDLDGQLVRPGVPGGPRGAHRGDARQPAHGRRAARGVRRTGARCSRRAMSRCRSVATPPRRCCCTRRHRLRDLFERLVVWSAAAGVLWLAGATLVGDYRLLLWIPALALELAAPVAGYWLPGRGRAATTDYDIEGGHFAERCQTVHPHRARRIDRGHGRDRVRRGTHPDGCPLPRRRVRRDRGAVVAVLRCDGRARSRHDEYLRRPRSPRARRLHLSPPADRCRHHRDRGRQRPADRRATRRAPRRRLWR